MAKKLIELVGLWWAEAGRYNVLPLDDRFAQRSLGRGGLAEGRTKFRFFPGAVRIPEHAAPDTKNRSWAADAEVEIIKIDLDLKPDLTRDVQCHTREKLRSAMLRE
jgi:hypothetical protein